MEGKRRISFSPKRTPGTRTDFSSEVSEISWILEILEESVSTGSLLLKFFSLQFLVDIFLLVPGSVDSHILADPDPGSQNLADPTDPDPKRCCKLIRK